MTYLTVILENTLNSIIEQPQICNDLICEYGVGKYKFKSILEEWLIRTKKIKMASTNAKEFKDFFTNEKFDLSPIHIELLNLLNKDIPGEADNNNKFLHINARLKVSTLKENTFENFAGLEKLQLSLYSIDRFDPNVFNKLQNLKILDICDTRLQNIPVILFNKLVNLEELNMVKCNITNLEPFTFHALSKLKILDLSCNYFTELLPDVFYGLNKLTKLCMLFNSLERIDSKMFQHLNNVEELDMRYGEHLLIPENIFDNLPKLHSAFIGYCESEGADMCRSTLYSINLLPKEYKNKNSPTTNEEQYFHLMDEQKFTIEFDHGGCIVFS